jgi:signal transduction histidine kinase
LGIPAYNNGCAALEAATVSELLTTALEKQAALNAWVSERQHSIGDIANQVYLRETVMALISATSGSSDAEDAYAGLVTNLGNWAGEGHRFLSLEVIDAVTGSVIAATDASDEGKFREEQPYFINGLQAAYVQNPYYDLARQLPGMTAAAPVLSADGRVIAVLAGPLNMDEMNAIVQRRSGLHQSDDAYIVNTSNLFVTQPRLNPDPAVLQSGIHTEAVNRCLAQNSGVVAALDYHDVPAIIVYRWLPERQLCLVVEMDQAEALEPVLALRKNIVIISGMALLAAAALAYWLARTITRPIHQLAKGAAEIGSGNLEYRIAMPAKDEIGQLAGEFNHMAGSIENMQMQLNHRAEQLEVANKELEAFSYSISHDLRAPLRAMDGFSRILLEEHASQLSAEARRYLGLVRGNTQQMGHLIEDLLAFSQLIRQPLKKQTVAPAEVVRQALAELRAGQEERNIEVTIGDLPVCEADPALLKQVWVNLLSNALKFTRKRKVARIEAGYMTIEDFRSQNADWAARLPQSEILNLKSHSASLRGQVSAIYYVRDNGVGFDMQYVHKLFGVFQRLHRSEEYEGTGVGLAIVQRIVHRHGGRIWAEAEVDKGATFYFTLGGGTR